MIRRLAAVMACAIGMAACGGGEERPAPAPPSSGPDRAAVDAARIFLDGYVAGDGRVRRPDQGDDTVSEGQAYAMLAAAATGDEERFDRVWAWTTAELRRPDGLLSFRWAAGEVVDEQAATDADLDAARALLVASCRFERPELGREAQALGRAVLEHEVAAQGGRRLLAAGPWATGAPATLNPSYYEPETLAALAASSSALAPLRQVSADTRRAVGELSAPLPPDWAELAAGRLRPVARPEGEPPGRWSFDAPRTLLRLTRDPDPAGRRIAARAWPVLRDAEDPAVVERELDGSPAGDSRHPVALVGAASAATAAGDEGAAARLLDRAGELQGTSPTYYGGAMVALGRLFLQTDRLTPGC